MAIPQDPQTKTFTIVYHKTSSASVSDLTGTKRVFNDEINDFSVNNSFAINFTSNNANYMYIRRGTSSISYSENGTSWVAVYDSGQEPPFVAGWTDNAYKTIEITGGSDATNSDLIAWLQANATQQIDTSITFELTESGVYKARVCAAGYSPSAYSNSITYSPSVPYLTFSSPNTFTLNVINANYKQWDGTLEYSTDTINWSVWDGVTTLSSTSSGTTKYLYLRGSNNTYITGNGSGNLSGHWVLTGSNISCNGNIETLLDYQTVANGEHPIMAFSCYKYMFYGCTSLVSAPELPATTLVQNCYQSMFQNCTSLTATPTLPATTLAYACYSQMFYGCTSLTTATILPATTLIDYCYNKMFYECTALTSAPTLSATTSALYCCQSMFYGCTSLTTAPTLSATTLAQYCYYSMFEGCISLTTAPTLPATTLAQRCYGNMFRGCTSLTTPAIMGGGTTQVVSAKNCCYYMYYGCTSLNIYTSSSGHTAFYKAITYSESSSDTSYQSSYYMFYNCKIDGSTSTNFYLTAGTQYYY